MRQLFCHFCNVRNSVIFILCLILSNSFAQVLNNSKGEAFENKPFFNQTFIAKNKIKSIKGQFSYKKSGKAMLTTNYYYAYNFNPKGELESTFETKTDDGTVDTTWNVYLYNELGLLAEHKQGTRQAKTGVVYQYDSKNRVVSEDYSTESIDSTGQKVMLLINTETMSYEDYGKQVKKTILNSYGLPYITEMSYYDSNGYLLEVEEKYIRTSNFIKKLYSYNDSGLLVGIKIFHKGHEAPVEEMTFKYDDFGNLLEKHFFKHGEFITDTQVVYNEKSKLMTAVIIRDVPTNFIMVIRYGDYEFYE